MMNNLKQANMEWISVKDRLPEKRNGCSHSENVNILIDNDGDMFVTTGSYRYLNKLEWVEYIYNNNYNNKITHWMPLPKTPSNE